MKIMKHLHSFQNFLSEALTSKSPNEVEAVEVDMAYDDKKDAEEAWKKFNLKVKEIKGDHIVTGKKKDILAYLQSEFYEMDEDSIKEFFPELLEGSLEEECVAVINESYYPKNRGGELEGYDIAEEVARKYLKVGSVIVGTMVAFIRPDYAKKELYRAMVSYSSYPLTGGGSNGSIVFDSDPMTKEAAENKCKSIIKDLKLA